MTSPKPDAAPKRPNGRPSEFTPEMADTICERLAAGESLRQVCAGDDMPDRSTVMRWTRLREDFCSQYARAREDLLEHWADQIVDISDDGRNDWIVREDGSRQFDNEHATRSRLRVDTRKWLMSKLAPKRYGDKLAHTGPDDGPVKVEVGWAKPGE